MVSVTCEDAGTIFDGLSLDNDSRVEFLLDNFTFGDAGISYSLTPLVVFYQKLNNWLHNDEQKQLWHEMYETLHKSHCHYINIEN